MNITSLLSFYFINSQAQFLQRDINREIAQSLYFVIERFFMSRSSSFIFVLSCQREHTMNFYTDLLEILFGYWGDIKTQIVINEDGGGPTASGERIYNMLLVDSSESFLKIDPAPKVRNYDSSEYYFVFLQNRDRFLDDDIQRILNYCWRNYIINVNIEVQKATGEIIVYTYFPFTAGHCGEVIPVEVNRYENGTMKNEDLFPQKLADMYSCTVKVATWHESPYVQLASDKTTIVGGFEGALLLQLSEMMNFAIHVAEPPNDEKRGVVSGNRSTGAFRMLLDKEVDIALGYIWFTGIRAEVATPSDSYYQSRNVAVLLGYMSFYELVQSNWVPFDGNALTALLSAFLITSCMVAGLASMARRSQVLGDLEHRSVVLNHIACTLGLPSFIEPKRNWARIFLINWMICSLVIRTNYGSMLFHIARNNLFRRAPARLEDVLRLNYTYVFERIAYEGLRHTSILAETGLRYIFVPNERMLVYAYLEQHPFERLLTIAPLEFVVDHVVVNRKAGHFNVLKKPLISQNCCMYFPKHSFLVDRVNHIIRRLSEVGLLDAWMKKYFDMTYISKSRTSRIAAIGMQELEVVFCICGWMLIGSCLVFCLELVSSRVSRLRVVMRKL